MLSTSPRLHQGMTLVEIAVGLVIIGLLLVMGLPSFGQWLQNSQIRTAAEAIQNGLQLARTEAVRMNTTVQFVLGTGSGWTVGCVNASATCPATIQSRVAAEGSANAVVTASEVVASTGAAAAAPLFTNTLVFNGMGRLVSWPPTQPPPTGTACLNAGSNAVISISNPTGGTCASASGGMRCLNVVVTQNGQIRMCDPVLASTDPRGC